MGLVQPFRGVRFSSQAGEMSQLIAPPYDVISDEYRKELYSRSDYNVVRISKSAEIENEEPNNHYQKASQNWCEWREKGITLQDEKPNYYFYEQEFQIPDGKGGNNTYQRLGLVCAHKLVDFGKGVLPHEKTLSGPKEDRHRLLKQTKTHFGQIFGLYADDDGSIDQKLREYYDQSKLISESKDDDGVIHRLKRTDNPEQVGVISGLFENSDMIIADGHHRYETALKFSKEQGTLESSYLMMTAVSLANPGLVILPTHRLVKNLENWNQKVLLSSLESSFDIHILECDVMNKEEKKNELLSAMNEKFKAGKSALGLYSNDGNFVLLVKKEGVSPDVEGSGVFKSLDVVTLHKLVLEDHLEITQEKLAAQTNVEYIKDSGDAIDQSIAKVDSGSHQAVFLMNPTPVDQTRDVALNGEKMPQKSTFFFPKVFTGLVTYSIEPGVVES